MPWLSLTIWSQTAASSGPYTLFSNSARVALAEAVDEQLRKPGEDVVANACAGSAHHRDPLGEQPTADESEELCRGLVEPLPVVHDADERLSLGRVCQQAQRRQPDQKPVGRSAHAKPEHGRERLALRDGQPAEVIQHRAHN